MTPRNHSRATLGARYGDQRRRRDAMRAQRRFWNGFVVRDDDYDVRVTPERPPRRGVIN